MHLDYSTLAIVLGVTMIVRVTITTSQWVVNRSYHGIGLWALASVFSGIAFAVVAARSSVPYSATLAMAQNTLLVVAVGLEYAGSLAFLGRRVPWRALGVTLALFVVVFSAFVFAYDDIDIRTAIFHVVLTAITWLTAWAFVTQDAPALRISSRYMATVLGLAGLFYAARAVGAATGITSDSLPEATTIQTIELLVALVEGLLLTFGIVVMVNQRLNADVTSAKEHFELLYHSSPDASIITRFDDGVVVSVNEGFSAMTGFAADEVVGTSARDFLWRDPDDRQRMIETFGDRGEVHDLEVSLKHKGGADLVGMLSGRTFDQGGVRHILSVIRDITARKLREEELARLATTDPLTGAANRRHFIEMAHRDVARAVREGTPMSIVLIDMDHLKSINDTHGHAAGDDALIAFSEACGRVLRETDVLGRLGGDEFVVLLPDSQLQAACEVAQRIRMATAARSHEGRTVPFTVCQGVVQVGPDEELDGALARADLALYRCKTAGRDRIECG